jgi:hypothetical protein
MNWKIFFEISRQARLNELLSGRPRGIKPSGGIKKNIKPPGLMGFSFPAWSFVWKDEVNPFFYFS